MVHKRTSRSRSQISLHKFPPVDRHNSCCVIIDLYECFRHHLLRQTLKQTQIFVFIHIIGICYFRVEIPFGSKERFLADPISLAPSSLESV